MRVIINMSKNNLENIIKKEDKPFLSLARLAEKFHSQPYATKIAEVLIGGGLSLGTLVSCTGTVTPEPPPPQQSTEPIVTPEPSQPPGPVEELYLGVPVVKQEELLWCLPAATKSVLNYYGMEITQKEIADYVIAEDGLGYALLLEKNAYRLGIEVHANETRTLEEIKNEIMKENPVIVLLDYSLEQKDNHFYIIDGFNEEEMRLMCPIRGFVYWSYDYIKELNNNWWVGEGGGTSSLYYTTLVWPKDKSIKSNFYREKAIQIIREQTDLFDKF